jgi:hypothetical protein
VQVRPSESRAVLASRAFRAVLWRAIDGRHTPAAAGAVRLCAPASMVCTELRGLLPQH